MPTAQIDLAGIAKAEGGKTVGEVFGESTALAGKPVSVRGKVVKVNAQIMGKNWLHLRDGSGSDADATNDLTVTTAGELPKVGDTVLVSGQVTTNKDFGMGYQYPVIIEDAAVKVEATTQ
jgi:exonuclease VII large subunit